MKVNYYTSLLVTLALIISSCGASHRLLQPENDWVFLAQGHANHMRETDVFKIKSKEKFAALRLHVYHQAISIRSVKVTLINGDVLLPVIDDRISPGERSRTIELAVDGRQLEKISIKYKSDGKLFSDKALIQIAGLKPGKAMR